ncbi:MAG: glutaminyl-peptide cyclotransferase [Acidobacteriota bacterium]
MSLSKGRRRRLKRVQAEPLAARQARKGRIALAGTSALGLAACGWLLWSNFSSGASNQRLEFLQLQVLRTFHHDRQAFTQGLLWHRAKLYESTGQYGHSTLRRLDPQTGRVEQRLDLNSRYFGEGLALQGGRLIQLTWRAETALIHGLESLEPTGRMRYQGEGWGLCWDGRRFIMSDGSSLLTFRDGETFSPTGRLQVTLRGRPLNRLNELEFAQDSIYANVWQQDFIVRIDPGSGRVTGQIDASGLLPRSQAPGADVLNGIAYNPRSDTFYLTGKYWPQMFEVRFVARNPPAEAQRR